MQICHYSMSASAALQFYQPMFCGLWKAFPPSLFQSSRPIISPNTAHHAWNTSPGVLKLQHKSIEFRPCIWKCWILSSACWNRKENLKRILCVALYTCWLHCGNPISSSYAKQAIVQHNAALLTSHKMTWATGTQSVNDGFNATERESCLGINWRVTGENISLSCLQPL